MRLYHNTHSHAFPNAHTHTHTHSHTHTLTHTHKYTQHTYTTVAVEKHNEKAFVKQPEWLQGGTMRPYQLKGFTWLVKGYHHGMNLILADEMGLGKTMQTVSLLGHL
jgi:SNF2 family DNA or RNA helicase